MILSAWAVRTHPTMFWQKIIAHVLTKKWLAWVTEFTNRKFVARRRGFKLPAPSAGGGESGFSTIDAALRASWLLYPEFLWPEFIKKRQLMKLELLWPEVPVLFFFKFKLWKLWLLQHFWPWTYRPLRVHPPKRKNDLTETRRGLRLGRLCY